MITLDQLKHAPLVVYLDHNLDTKSIYVVGENEFKAAVKMYNHCEQPVYLEDVKTLTVFPSHAAKVRFLEDHNLIL